MCGIVGLLTKTPATPTKIKWFKTLLLVDQLRGEHSTGVAKINTKDNEVSIHKRAVNAVQYLAEKESNEFLESTTKRANIFIGHNRYATMGAKTDENAHPFQYKHITMVHNGTVDRWTLSDLEGWKEPDVVVDSEAVCRTIAELGIDEAAKKLSGAFSLVWWNSEERSLNFLRNDKRPMYLCHFDESLLWASEEAFLGLILSRERNVTQKNMPYETAVNTLYKWTFKEDGTLDNEGRCSIRKVELKDIENPFQGGYRGGHYGGGWGGDRSDSGWAGRSKYAEDGTYLGSESSVREADLFFEKNKFQIRMGYRVKAVIDSVRRTSKWDTSVHISGRYISADGAELAFQTYQGVLTDVIENWHGRLYDDRVKLPVGTFTLDEFNEELRGVKGLPGNLKINREITGTVSGQFKNEGVEKIMLAKIKGIHLGDDSTPFVESPKEKGAKRSGENEGVARFPLKANGFTFKNPQEFLDLTSSGCACCGNIPTIFNRNNKSITAYSTCGSREASAKDFEFICGDCIEMDGQGNS